MTPTEKRYIECGENGTLKDTIIKLNKRLEVLDKLADAYQRREEFEKMLNVHEKLFDVRENWGHIMSQIPSTYYPKTLLIN